MIYILLVLGIIIESTISVVPLALIILVTIYVIKNRSKETGSEIFLIAFLAGLLLDILKLNPIGSSSLFLVISLFLISGYSRKFEINTFYFVGIFSLVSSFLYLFLQAEKYLLPASVVAATIGILLYGASLVLVRPRLPRQGVGLVK